MYNIFSVDFSDDKSLQEISAANGKTVIKPRKQRRFVASLISLPFFLRLNR